MDKTFKPAIVNQIARINFHSLKTGLDKIFLFETTTLNQQQLEKIDAATYDLCYGRTKEIPEAIVFTKTCDLPRFAGAKAAERLLEKERMSYYCDTGYLQLCVNKEDDAELIIDALHTGCYKLEAISNEEYSKRFKAACEAEQERRIKRLARK